MTRIKQEAERAIAYPATQADAAWILRGGDRSPTWMPDDYAPNCALYRDASNHGVATEQFAARDAPIASQSAILAHSQRL
jgi:hypothetical protein